jgi:uncharacterized peroxidase-related enzyme
MTFITTNIPQPGIVELLFYKGATGKALTSLAQTLLHGPSSLTPGERELIAAYVSHLNNCEFCHESHSAVANVHLNDDGKIIKAIKENLKMAPVSEKLKALLEIAGKVQKSGREVTEALVNNAKTAGATDEEIHDTVLIAAAFCMFNRYVDGLATNLPKQNDEYLEMGAMLANKGYRYPPLFLRKFVVWMMKRAERKKQAQL